MTKSTKEKGGTFSLNKTEPIHRWFPYMEGYSSCLITHELDKLLHVNPNISTIYDPFCGAGTTALVAAQRGLKPFFSETNPFMQGVIDTKINVTHDFISSGNVYKLQEYIDAAKNCEISECTHWDGFEKYFYQKQLSELLSIKVLIGKENNLLVKKILMLALSSIVVKVSKMTRRGDLRFATEKEYRDEGVIENFVLKLAEIIEDIEPLENKLYSKAVLVSEDARDNQFENYFDCVITSPPYLNGTNYIRNTKLELKLNDFIQNDKDLPSFHAKGIVAGINNVSKRTETLQILPFVEEYIDKLLPVAYDERIVKMVIRYFNDMKEVVCQLNRSMKDHGDFIMDIGDSQFAGIHIPTHQILIKICMEQGFSLLSDEILRSRRSKNGMILTQKLLRFRLEK